MGYYIYILASSERGTLYVGVTNDLVRRVWEHREHVVASFTQRYDVTRLVYFEEFEDPINAIAREKRLKRYKRSWKIESIERQNPTWRDLYGDITA